QLHSLELRRAAGRAHQPDSPRSRPRAVSAPLVERGPETAQSWAGLLHPELRILGTMTSMPSTRRVRLPAGIALALIILWMSVGSAQQAPSSKGPVTSAGKAAHATTPAPAAKPKAALPITAKDVLMHVRRSVDWYHDLAAVEQISLPGVD